MESHSADVVVNNTEKTTGKIVPEELSVLGDSESLVTKSANNISVEVSDSESVEGFNVKRGYEASGYCPSTSSEPIVGTIDGSNWKNSVNSRESDIDKQNERELPRMATFTVEAHDNQGISNTLYTVDVAETVRNEEIFYDEFGAFLNGSNKDSSVGVVEAININGITRGNESSFKINFGEIAMLHDEFLSIGDVLETNVDSSTSVNKSESSPCESKESSEQRCLSDIILQGKESDFEIVFESLPQHIFDNSSVENSSKMFDVVKGYLDNSKHNIDSSDRNNNSSEDNNDDVIFEDRRQTEIHPDISQLPFDSTDAEPMTCEQFIKLVTKNDPPQQSPDENESLPSSTEESNFIALRRLDTIASIEGDKDFEFNNTSGKTDDDDDDSVITFNPSLKETQPLLLSTDNICGDKNNLVEKPAAESRVRRKSTGIFIKKYEKEGKSRSPSPVPRRYRKHSAPVQKHPVIDIAPTYWKSVSDISLADLNINPHPVNNVTLNTVSSLTKDFSKPVNIIEQENNDDSNENDANVSLSESYKSSTLGGRFKDRFISGGSVRDYDIPSVHRSKPIEIDVKGKKIVYDLVSYQGCISPEAPNDDFGFDFVAKKESKTEKQISNEDFFTNKAVLAAYAHKKLRALRNSFRRERRRTVSSGSESTCSEPTRRRVESQSSVVLKLTERDDCNRDVIEGFIEPLKLPPMKQRTLSSGDENSVDTASRPKVSRRNQRSRSHGNLGQTVPVRIKIPSALTEPWLGAWDDTVLRIVEPNDTLASVAAHFDITPSELAILNRLPSRTVFPGQVIRVPDKRRRDPDSEDKENKQDNPEGDKGDDKDKGEDKGEDCDEEMDMLEKLRLTSPKPGHAERVKTPLSPTPDPSHQRFLKINVRHITDGQGVVSGVLLVTSNAVMFDPNVSDPLVIEHGPESYGVIAPMEYVVNVAIYHDIAHMRVGSHDQFRPDWPKPEVYHLKEPFPPTGEGEGSSGTLLTTNQGDSLDSGDPHHSPSAREDSLLAKDETFPELRSSTEDEEEEDAGSLCSCSVPREGDAFPKAFDRDLVTPTNLSTTTEKQESEAEDPTPKNESVALIRSLEERRKSSLDHHWAVPSKVRSLEEQSASVSDTQGEDHQQHNACFGPDKVHSLEEQSATVSDPQVMDNNRRNSEGLLVKLSCHDSGIDIRDPPPPVVPQVPRKSTYSDADVLLSDDFVPPVPIQPLRPAAVSFSLDQSHERSVSESHDGVNLRDKDDQEKETKKNKMLKRLSYPLSWMEGLSGDKEEKDSLPSSAESHPPSSHSASSSVFSKVFSSSPINMVTDFSSGLFTKTPSEEGGRFPFPPATPEPPPTPATVDPSKPQGLASFSPSNITSAISSVGRSSVGTFIRQQHQSHPPKDRSAGPKLDYRSMVSVEDMPELFVSFDKLIPRPAQSCDDPPLYLRLRMGKPKDKKIPKSTPIMSYGKKKMRPEYWFSVPRERVDDLYRFLMVWVPQLYGDLDEARVADRGYELVDSDTELWETEDSAPRPDGRRGSDDDDIADLTRESWEVLKAPYCKLYTILKTQATMGSTDTGEEVLSMSEELRRALYASSSLDLELCVPDLNGVTEILSEDHRKQLCRHLPARAEGYVWTLVFSTSQHGFSLNSMYRKMTRIESPILMVIQDTENNVFGALTSCALKMSDHFYGTGESLLFRFAPDCQVYNWTGDNMYFIKGNNESLSIGAGDGKFGLWLDGDLYQGRTEPCNTYGNDPLTPSVDFVVKTLECWAFI